MMFHFFNFIIVSSNVLVSAKTPIEKLSEATNNFAFKIYPRLAKGSGNHFFSPLSLMTSLSMIHVASGGITAQDINATLCYKESGISPNDLLHACKELLTMFGEGSHHPSLELVDAILLDKSVELNDAYANKIKNTFKGNFFHVDFRKNLEEAITTTNDWIKKATHNHIDKILERPLDPLSRMLLLNAVYFKGLWESPFDKTQTTNESFYNGGGSIGKQVPMMSASHEFEYGFIVELQSHVLSLPYKNETEMLILLPEDRSGIADLEDRLNWKMLKSVSIYLNRVNVHVRIPKFSYDESRNLRNDLIALGMGHAFREGANFTGFGTGSLHLSQVLHKSKVEVNEEGTVAAASTKVEVVARAVIPSFIADHPFLFFILEKHLHILLFVGKVTQL